MSPRRDSTGKRGLWVVAFATIQLLAICAAAGWAAYRIDDLTAERELPALRSRPLDVPPLYDEPEVVSDEQLSRSLSKLGLRFDGETTAISHVDHALRFWTPATEFDDPSVMPAHDMLLVLTDHRRFAEAYGPDTPPLLIDEGSGVRVRTLEGRATSSHVDHTMACLAEVGLPLDFPVVTPTRETTFRAVVEQSLRDFSLNQQEYEWSAMTYVLLLPPVDRWVTSEGQVMTFDRIARRIMREALPLGVCFGHHRMHTLVMFLRVDDQMRRQGEKPILSSGTREDVVRYLQDITAKLVAHQHKDGFWDANWPHGLPPPAPEGAIPEEVISRRFIATGHPMEWWALAPAEVLPPKTALVAAGQWLVRSIDELTPDQVQRFNPFLSHAGRALALWRGRLPNEVTLIPSQGATTEPGDGPGKP